MKLPWWTRSWTIWAAVLAVALTFGMSCFPVTRTLLHQWWLTFVWIQSITHALLRVKTEHRTIKLSEAS